MLNTYCAGHGPSKSSYRIRSQPWSGHTNILHNKFCGYLVVIKIRWWDTSRSNRNSSLEHYNLPLKIWENCKIQLASILGNCMVKQEARQNYITFYPRNLLLAKMPGNRIPTYIELVNQLQGRLRIYFTAVKTKLDFIKNSNIMSLSQNRVRKM